MNPWVEPVPGWMSDLTVLAVGVCVGVMYLLWGVVSLYFKFRK